MKISVNPPTQINSVTGQEMAVPNSQRVEYTGEPVVNEYAHGHPDNLAYESSDRKPVLRDPVFQVDATSQDTLNYWTNSKPATQDEMLHIQDEYTRTGDEKLARFLT